MTFHEVVKNPEKAFVCWRLAGETSIHALSGERWNTGFPESRGLHFVFQPFIEQKNCPSLYLSGKLSVFENSDALPLQTPILPPEFSGTSEAEFTGIVSKAKTAMAQGKLAKVVLARRAAAIGGIDESNLFAHFVKKFPQAFCSLVNIPARGTWVGASPEILLKQDSENAETVALAGTKISEHEIAWNSKEISEQGIVLEHIRNQLNSLFMHEIEVGEAESLFYGTLRHRLNRIFWKMNFSRENLQKCLEALHPTPAVCGYPRMEAMNFILQNENFERGYYAGFLGPLDFESKRADLYVNIRQVKFWEDKIEAIAGAGIVSGSDPQQEWREVISKQNALF